MKHQFVDHFTNWLSKWSTTTWRVYVDWRGKEGALVEGAVMRDAPGSCARTFQCTSIVVRVTRASRACCMHICAIIVKLEWRKHHRVSHFRLLFFFYCRLKVVKLFYFLIFYNRVYISVENIGNIGSIEVRGERAWRVRTRRETVVKEIRVVFFASQKSVDWRHKTDIISRFSQQIFHRISVFHLIIFPLIFFISFSWKKPFHMAGRILMLAASPLVQWKSYWNCFVVFLCGKSCYHYQKWKEY